MNVSKDLFQDKACLLGYLREKAAFRLKEIVSEKGNHKEKASAMNHAIIKIKDELIENLKDKATKESWEKEILLQNVLIVTYCSYAVMLEYRNRVWPYEYMAFSRRVGELWEPFCKLCWGLSTNSKISFYVPPSFIDVKKKLSAEFFERLDELSGDSKEKNKLKEHYVHIWDLITSGEIKLVSDLHFVEGSQKYVVDFKSGFSSNEKGNTNRLLMVATVYALLGEYKCIMFVRSTEDESNHYLQTLKKSGKWTVFCGDAAYKKIEEFTEFPIKEWIKKNVNWKEDIGKDTLAYLKKQDLVKYLKW